VRRTGVEVGDHGDGEAVEGGRPALEGHVDPPHFEECGLDERPARDAGGG
jgi:hypothetical protein